MFNSVGIVWFDSVSPLTEILVTYLVANGRVQNVSKLTPADVITIKMVLCVGAENGVQQAVVSPGAEVQFAIVRLSECLDT